MLLAELFPAPEDYYDNLDLVSPEDTNGLNADAAKLEKRAPYKSPSKTSNIAKAKKIRNLSRMKAREANPERDDTHHQYNLGSHHSTLGFNRGSHGAS